MIFGGVTVVSGIFGTLAGGYILDRMNNTISNAFKVVSVLERDLFLGLTLNNKIKVLED